MRIAIIGSGISGLTSAYYLQKQGHDVFVFEASDYIGGHTHTIDVSRADQHYAIDTGFIVFNHQTYPNFTHLLNELHVDTQNTDMSFSVYDPKLNFQYSGGSLNGLFADRRNLFNPKFYRLLGEIHRFHRLAKSVLASNNTTSTLQQFLKQHQFHTDLGELYLYPLISALWSSPSDVIGAMPIYFVSKFFENHALLKMLPDISWKVVTHGSASYISPLIHSFKEQVYVNTAVVNLRRDEKGFRLFHETGPIGQFDAVVVATHSDQALRLLDAPTALEVEILSSFSYEDNDVILHQDETLMPSSSRAWASWNYRLSQEHHSHAVLTYNMNKLQSIPASVPFFVSLNAAHLIHPETVIQRFSYSHPQYTLASLAAQSRQQELNAQSGIYFCGAYWGFGFHEDGVNSALAVCRQLAEHHE
ncbi:MAG TPA: FAD-dependent oxidoreductase [Legionella sp.]|nr:FAD-dependent oxidoreductase [Legionella sp.]